ncbi:MAG TPA: nucleotide sugar dehydrogenase [Stellaceae bacterium]|nr:nucleotide sugar dehydrogenase [Stellaceae bacterium]
MTSPVVAFAGMTHLGLVSASAVAAAGFDTICFDPDEVLIRRLARGELPVLEPNLPEMIIANGRRQRFTSSIGDIGQCDVVYVAPDIATDDAGRSDTSALRTLIGAIVPAMQETAVLVVLSQVEPGFTRALTAPPPDRRYYQVETLVFGRAVERATKPERYIVGCADPSRPLDARFNAVLKAFNCPILPMRYESAELAKISINMCLVASIGVANTMAELCEALGADWSEIVPALKLDRRIGQYSYLAPGLGIAGGNLERDLATVIRLAGERGTDSGIVKAWIANSRHCRDWALRTLRRTVLVDRKDPLVAVWGLAYKENTHSVKNSPSLATLRQLPEVRFRVHDPAVHLGNAENPRAETAGNAVAALAGADALMILTPWPEYREVAPTQIAAALPGRLVIDPYRVLDPNQAHAAGLTYFTLGMPPVEHRA